MMINALKMVMTIDGDEWNYPLVLFKIAMEKSHSLLGKFAVN